MSDNGSVFPKARLVSILTLASRVLGLVRDVLLAAVFGRAGLSAFALAFKIPNLFRRLFGEGALSAVFIPAYTRRLAAGDEDGARKTFKATLTFLVFVMVGFVLAGVAAALLIHNLPVSENTKLAMKLIIVLSPYAVIICATALGAAALQSLGSFAPGALAPVILNVFWISASLVAAKMTGLIGGVSRPASGSESPNIIFVLPVGILIGSVAALALEWIMLARRGMAVKPASRPVKDPGLAEIKRDMAPILLGLAALQVNSLIDDVIARAFVSVEANGTLYFANRLIQFPLALFGIPVAIAVFPTLEKLAAKGKIRQLAHAAHDSLAAVFFLCAPAAVGLAVLGKPIVALLFGSGRFSGSDVLIVAATVAAYGAGLWAYSANHVLARASYSLDDKRSPVKIALIAMFANLALNLILVRPMREAGLGLATALSAVLQFVLLLILIRRKTAHLSIRRLAVSFARSAAGCAPMGLAAWGAAKALAPPDGGKSAVALQTFGAIFAGAVTYWVYAKLVRAPELHHVFGRAKKKVVETEPPDA